MKLMHDPFKNEIPLIFVMINFDDNKLRKRGLLNSPDSKIYVRDVTTIGRDLGAVSKAKRDRKLIPMSERLQELHVVLEELVDDDLAAVLPGLEQQINELDDRYEKENETRSESFVVAEGLALHLVRGQPRVVARQHHPGLCPDQVHPLSRPRTRARH